MSRETDGASGSGGKRVLVCGATGYLGRHVVLEAHRRGHRVRALARDPERLGDARAACDEVFVGQATDEGTLAGLCDGIDVVISSLGNRTLARRPTVWDVDFRANMNVLRRAEEAKVGQLVFVSVLRGAEARASVPQIEARERVVDALRSSSIPWTVVRPSGFYNDMGEILEMARKGTVWIPGKGDTRFNPIHGADLAGAILDHVGDPASLGKELPVGGPDVLTMREIGELAFSALGKPPRIRSFPAWMLGGAAAVIKPFNVNVASLIAMFGVFIGEDAVTERHGSHHLADFYRDLAAQGKKGGTLV